MDDELEKAVMRAIETMRDNLGEQLTIDDLARAAIFSKFHFSRVFHRVTGLSPGRFLSALRLQEAKRLLESTALGVTEISHQVGYSSVGTFSSRFKSSVGVSPTRYRQLDRVALAACAQEGERSAMSILGDVASPVQEDGPVFAGLFPERILQGMPASYAVIDRPGPFVLRNVPVGTWHLLACSLDGSPSQRRVGHVGPITIRQPGAAVHPARLQLRPARPLDPPALLAMSVPSRLPQAVPA